MGFGQYAGPPATSRQLDELLALFRAAGHDSFRGARGPMRLSQRQATGKFTRDEAEELINRLQQVSDDRAGAPVETLVRLSNTELLLRRVPTRELAGELQRRGWLVVEP